LRHGANAFDKATFNPTATSGQQDTSVADLTFRTPVLGSG